MPAADGTADGTRRVSQAQAGETISPRVTTADATEQTPAPEGAIGTPGPTIVLDTAPDGSWVALCQVRRDTDGDGRISFSLGPHGEHRGDRLTPFFVSQSGAGETVDDFVGADPGGRFVGLLQGGELLLLDTKTGQRQSLTALGADPRNDHLPFASHRALSFDPLGRFVAYIRVQGTSTWVVLRNLESGVETPIDPGEGVLWRTTFEPGGDFLRLSVVREDTNGNGRLGWGARPAEASATRCRGPLQTFDVPAYPPDKPTELLYHLRSGRLIRVPNFVASNGDAYITRSDNGELWQFGLDTPALALSSDKCGGKLLHIDDVGQGVLLGCAGEYGARRALYWRTAKSRTALGMEVAPYEVDGRLPGMPHVTILNPKNESHFFSFETGKHSVLPDGTVQLAQYQGNVLAQRDGGLYFVDSKGVETSAFRKRPSLAGVLQQGGWCAIGSELYDLRVPSFVGVWARPPLALDADGRGLHAASTEGIVPQGPLRWQTAQ